VCLHQQGCHAPRLHVVPDQVPGPLCHCAGATAAATARTTRVDRCEQARVATLATAAPAVAGEVPTAASGAVAGEVPTSANGPPAVVESAAIPPCASSPIVGGP
jgi:hypothetical protein